MQIKNKKEIWKVLLISVVSIFIIAIIVKAATTIGTNVTTEGTLNATGLTTLGAATSTSATSTKYIMVGSAFTLPSSFNYDGDLSVSSDLVVNNKATSTVALWVGSAGTANSINLTGGDLYVQNDSELDGALYLTGAATIGGALNVTGLTTFTTATGTSATTTKYLMVGSAFTLPSTFDYNGDLAVSSDLVVGGTASTTSAIFSGSATTTGNMVIGHNNQATNLATTTLTIGSYNGGAAGNGTCLKLRQGGAWIYCVPSLAGITCSATSCE